MAPDRLLLPAFAIALLAAPLAACGPSSGARECTGAGGEVDTDIDPMNCGRCGNVCAEGLGCVDGRCQTGVCQPGTMEECYSGQDGTQDVGPCHTGTHVCDETGNWSSCHDEVVPVGEVCGDGIDQNCNGTADEDVDADGDGFRTCGGDCCDSTECSAPVLVNPGAFDAAGNGVDDDCNGLLDDTLLLCDQTIASNTQDAGDFARAIDICQTATEVDRRWGVISAGLTLADGTGTPDPEGHAVRPKFGTNLLPMGGVSVAILSTGGAAAKTDTNPGYHAFSGFPHATGEGSNWPADFTAAHGGTLPNAPGCPGPDTELSEYQANDPEMLTLRVRVPTNARSFKLSSNFYSAEFPEWACSEYNDFFVILLDSTYTGTSPNPTDKNLAFFQPMGSTDEADRVPVGVNLAHGNTGLFTQCRNGTTGCSGSQQDQIMTCLATDQLAGTGMDDPSTRCDSNQLVGGATGWLTTTGNVVPGEVITLRIAIWDTSDTSFDSLVVVDGFQWSTELSQPGTVIGRY